MMYINIILHKATATSVHVSLKNIISQVAQPQPHTSVEMLLKPQAWFKKLQYVLQYAVKIPVRSGNTMKVNACWQNVLNIDALLVVLCTYEFHLNKNKHIDIFV